MKKIIPIVSGILLVLIFIFVFAMQSTLIRSARTLGKIDSLSRFNYSAELTIDENRLSDRQTEFLHKLSEMMGVEASSLLNLKVKGSLYDDVVYAVISSKAIDVPVTKVYIRNNEAYINVKMIYDLISSHIAERYPLLAYFIPVWNYGEYITGAQLEEIFEVDFEKLFTLNTQELMRDPTFAESIAGLLTLDNTKNDGRTDYKTNWKNYGISFYIEEADNVPKVHFTATSGNKADAVSSAEGSISFDLYEEVIVPGSVVDENTVAGIKNIWSVLMDLFYS